MKTQNAKRKNRRNGRSREIVTNDERVTIGDLKRVMRTFVSEREWEKFHTPRNLAASVAVEAGELLELFQWLTVEEVALKCRRRGGNAAFRRAVGEELSDVLMFLMSLANAMGIQVGAAVIAKMEKNREKYPAERFRGWYERPPR